jgi:hypothetical protein
MLPTIEATFPIKHPIIGAALPMKLPTLHAPFLTYEQVLLSQSENLIM